MGKKLLALVLCLLLTACVFVGCSADLSDLAELEQQISQLESELEAVSGDLLHELENLENTAESQPAQSPQEETQADTAETEQTPAPAPEEAADLPELDENGIYDSKEDVALYLHLYGHLPSNYISKKDAQDLGWPGGSLEPYAPGMCIGGSHFGNYEGLLPEAPGRTYQECDIDTLGADSRGPKRIVYSNDGLIYYTGDHYESFELLYGDES